MYSTHEEGKIMPDKYGKTGNQERNMTSIVKKMNRRMMGQKLLLYIKQSMLLFVFMFVGALLIYEYAIIGEISFSSSRSLVGISFIKECCYVVRGEQEEILLTVLIYPFLVNIGRICMIFLTIHLLGIVFSYGKNEREIRRILAPINEIAIKADELSRMSFTEEKYQYIEDVISTIQPEETELLSFGDKDLQGIEAAMNNLLMRMRDTYRQQARFVNDASHELRTPIAVIEGYVNMLARWGTEDEKVLNESITALQREAGHMKHLVEQLLFLARGDSGKTKLEKQNISLQACMQEVYEESLLIDEQHVYRYRPTEDIYVEGDYMMLKQAVRILVDNSAKYTKEQDEIILSIGRNGEGRPYLQVQDTGIGMAESDVEHMFERFYRSDDARKYKGTGLGLSIAKWIVDKHGGYFEILSRMELGTRIRIIL